MLKKLDKFQSGNSPLMILVLVAVVGLMAYILLTAMAPFKSNLFSHLYPKDSSYAKGPGSGQGGGGSSKTKCSSCTLILSPNPAPPYSYVYLSGCGYTIGAASELGFITPTAATVSYLVLDSSGCIPSNTILTPYGAGSYTVQVLQNPTGGTSSKDWILMSSASLTVQ